MRNLVLGAVALLVSLAAYPAMAGNVRFTLQDNVFGETLSWTLPESPTPDFFDETSFDIDGPVFGSVHDPEFGDSTFALFGDFTFFTSDDDGGFQMDGGVSFPSAGFPFFFNTVGDQLFTGDTSAPTFRRGTFQLNDGDCGCSASKAFAASDFTLTIGGGVPEPATWALMIGGFGAAGVALRRRQAVAA